MAHRAGKIPKLYAENVKTTETFSRNFILIHHILTVTCDVRIVLYCV